MRVPKAVCIELSDDERSELEARGRRRKTSRGDAMRASIVLLAASGMTNLTIAKRLRTTRATVATWRMRVRHEADGRAERRAAPWRTAQDRRRQDHRGCDGDAGDYASHGDPLEHPSMAQAS